MSLNRNIGSNFIISILQLIISFAVSLVLARSLGPYGMGQLSYLLLIFGLVASYGDFGLFEATQYFLKRSLYTDKFVYQANLSLLIMFSLFYSMGLLFFRISGVVLTEYSIIIILFGIFYINFSLFKSLMSSIYIANEEIVKSNRYKIIGLVFGCILTFALWVLNMLDYKSRFIIVFLSITVELLLLAKSLHLKYCIKVDLVFYKTEFQYGITTWAARVSLFLVYQSDKFFIKAIGLSDLGIYTLAVTLSNLLAVIPGSVMSALNARFLNMEKDSAKREIYICNTIKYTFYICSLMAIAGIIISPIISIIFGNNFTRSIIPTIILLVGAVFLSIGQVSTSYFYSNGKTVFIMISAMMALIINISLNIALIPSMGINGAAWASTIAYLIYSTIYIIYFTYKEGIKFKYFFCFNKNDFMLLKSIAYKIINR